jgi:hypothetical protein
MKKLERDFYKFNCTKTAEEHWAGREKLLNELQLILKKNNIRLLIKFIGAFRLIIFFPLA